MYPIERDSTFSMDRVDGDSHNESNFASGNGDVAFVDRAPLARRSVS